MIEVVTVWAPRPDHPKWRDYLPLIHLQKRTAEKFGHRHTVVSDVDIPGVDVLRARLPVSLMHAMIAGVIARLKTHGKHHLVFVDADCLIARELSPTFQGVSFDLGLTRRINDAAPINNGAMYVPRRCNLAALSFFEYALSLCEDHWGGDQEAISQAASPIMLDDDIYDRHGARVAFMSMRLHNSVPKKKGMQHKSANPFVIHFKGEEAKGWMRVYAEQFILTAGDGKSASATG